jgi:hypothetical protein
MEYRAATAGDIPLLAAFNKELIEDERADTLLDLHALECRMRGWLTGDYRAVVFEVERKPIGYALFRPDEQGLHLRQVLDHNDAAIAFWRAVGFVGLAQKLQMRT